MNPRSTLRASRHATHFRSVAVGIAALAVVATSCAAEQPPAPVVPLVFDLDHDPAADIAPVDPDRTDAAPAVEVQLLLEDQLAWHGVTLVEAMRTAERESSTSGDGSSGSDSPWIDALVENTDDITGSIGLVYGPDGARAFHQQWAQHTQFLLDYAAARGRQDSEAMAEARSHLSDYVQDSASLLGTATAGHLPTATARSVLQTHVDHMLDQIDAANSNDHRRSTALAVEDHEYLVGIADALATAIAAQQPRAFPGPIGTDFAVFCSLTNTAAGAEVIRSLGPESDADRLHPSTLDPEDRLGTSAQRSLEPFTDGFRDARRSDDVAATVSSTRALLTAVSETARDAAPAG